MIEYPYWADWEKDVFFLDFFIGYLTNNTRVVSRYGEQSTRDMMKEIINQSLTRNVMEDDSMNVIFDRFIVNDLGYVSMVVDKDLRMYNFHYWLNDVHKKFLKYRATALLGVQGRDLISVTDI